MEPIEHMVRNTRTLVQELEKLYVRGGDWFVRLDLKEYFLSGSKDELVADCSKCIDSSALYSDLRDVFSFSLNYLLENQIPVLDSRGRGRRILAMRCGDRHGACSQQRGR